MKKVSVKNLQVGDQYLDCLGRTVTVTQAAQQARAKGFWIWETDLFGTSSKHQENTVELTNR